MKLNNFAFLILGCKNKGATRSQSPPSNFAEMLPIPSVYFAVSLNIYSK